MLELKFHTHAHSEYSNLRLTDSINRPEKMVDRIIELNGTGLCLTDHESLSGHVRIKKYVDSLKKKNPDLNFTLGLGNEIYLIDNREKVDKYYHFLLIAKDEIGYQQLEQLSSTAWYHLQKIRGQERVPTLKKELVEVIGENKGHLIASTACLAGELPTLVNLALSAKRAGDTENEKVYRQKINNFIGFCLNLFGEDFYIEVAPSAYKEQIVVNRELYKIAKEKGIKINVGCDSHYLTPEKRPLHKAYLNSHNEEREVDAFYLYAYMMDSADATKFLKESFEDEDIIAEIFKTTNEIANKIQNFSLFEKQKIPPVEVKNYEKKKSIFSQSYKNLNYLYDSDDIYDRYWINQCYDKLIELNKENDKRYLDELEEEARVKRIIGEKLETNMFRYPITLQHYIDMIWESGSIVGAGRGSSCAALNHYLLGVTQLDSIAWDLPFFRYLNDEREEIGDIDIDVCPSKRPIILDKIRKERSAYMNENLPNWAKTELGCTLVATFGTEKGKSVIQTACRGYRSEDYPDGIDVDTALYISSLIPAERGFLWEISDVVYGNEEKKRKPIKSFIREVNKFPGLLDIIMELENLISRRGSHASGVIMFDGNPFERCAFMRTSSGDIITQWDLHDVEYRGMTKYDFLVTEVCDKLVTAIDLLQKDGEIEPELSLLEVYNKYFHPDVLPLKDSKIWDSLRDGTTLGTFQFDSLEGRKAAKKIAPTSIIEMSDANGLLRLMGEEGEERPIDRYCRMKKDINIWYKEMNNWGLTKKEQETLEPYFLSSYGTPPSQEQLMRMLMDEDIAGFQLGEANAARKIVAKKQMKKIPELHKKILEKARSEKLGAYVWKHGVGPQLGYSFSVV